MGKRKRHRHTSAEEFRGLFRRGKPVRVSGIAEKLGVDRSTVTRRMRKHGTLTSINRNAAFCVLPEMCVFDESGFCRFGEVRFFRDGGQVDAIVRSVAASDRGMSSSEVRAATGAKAAMQLLKLVREGRLRREGRPRAYVYLAADADAAARQLARRRGEGERARTVVELLAEESRGNLQLLVQVLLTCLRHPQFDAKGVALSLVRRGCRTCAEQVRELLDRFGIVKKKGLLALMLVLEALSAPTTAAPGGAVPATEIVVALDDEERRKCGQRRFRNRSIRSAHAGVLAVKYETGSVGAGRMHPAQLRALAPPGMTFAYDAMAEVLNLRYVDLRQREEIRTILAAGSVPISAGSVSNLSRLGLACLEQVHEAAAENLGDHYRREAFILHMDGTHEGGQWCHFVVREGTGGHVLLARKIRSEHSEDIGEMLQRVRELFGRPDAVVSDMSAAIRKAAEGVLPDVPHLLCHFHFLKAVGIAVLGPDHDALGYGVKRTRSELKKLRRDCVAELRKGDRRQTWVISLIDRVNEYAGGLSGEGFPFDLPNLEYVRRCGEVLARVESLPVFRPDRATGAAAVGHLVGLRTVLRDHTRAGTGTARIERRAELFLELREILHPVTGDTRAPLNWGRIEDPARMADIEEGIEAFRDKARRMNARKSLSAGERKMWRSLHKTLKAHADHLDPLLEVRGRHYILPRTNNLSETGFRDMKRKQRRTTGNGDLKRQLDHMPAQVFYTENLADPVYREIAFGGRAMHECFADADWETVKTAVEEMKSPPRIGAVDHALINSDDFFDTVRAALAPGADAEAPKAVEDRILTP